MITGRKIAILVEEGFEETQFIESVRAVKNGGAMVTVIGSGSQKSYKGRKGMIEIFPDVSADSVNIADFNVIIIPGGQAPDRMRLYQSMIELVRKAFKANKIIAAIGHGPQLLISAEIVKGRRVTSWPTIAIDLKNAGALWMDESVIIDGNLITSRMSTDIPRFTEAIISALINNKLFGHLAVSQL
jgi:protease I